MNVITVSDIENVEHRAWLFATEVCEFLVYGESCDPFAEPAYLAWLDELPRTLRAYARIAYDKAHASYMAGH